MTIDSFVKLVIGEGQTVDDGKPTPLVLRDQGRLGRGRGSPQPPIGQPPAVTDPSAENPVPPTP